jgi:hypothetical protein
MADFTKKISPVSWRRAFPDKFLTVLAGTTYTLDKATPLAIWT